QGWYHSSNCALHQVVIVALVHVVLFDTLKHFREQPCVFPRKRFWRSRRIPVSEHTSRQGQRYTDGNSSEEDHDRAQFHRHSGVPTECEEGLRGILQPAPMTTNKRRRIFTALH